MNQMSAPKFVVGDLLKNMHSWAKHIPPYPVEDVMWDECWKCYTYGFPGVRIRIEECMLALVRVSPDLGGVSGEVK